jgi:hydrogenase nickel incorporation protein HypA/HybF
MHELSIAQNIVEIVEDHLPEIGVRKVKSVKLKVGELSGIVPDSLKFCFGAITADTPMQDVILEIERVPFVLECKKCGKVSTNEIGIFLCTVCGSDETKMISGNELLVAEIELFDEREVTA